MLHTFLMKLANALFGSRYRPERHYMRGPGPACRALATAPVRRRR